MLNYIQAVGEIKFDEFKIKVYGSLNSPLFRVSEVSELIDYSKGNGWNMINGVCEEDEKLKLPVLVSGQRRLAGFINENGLHNVLSQSRKPAARKWRRIISDELIRLRSTKGITIVEQFEEWDRISDTLFVDPETNILMQSVTVAGGDVIQVPYEQEEE